MLQMMFLFKIGLISRFTPTVHFSGSRVNTCHVEIFAATACNAKASNSSFKEDVWGETTLAVDFMTSQCPKTWRYALTGASFFLFTERQDYLQKNSFLYIYIHYIYIRYIFIVSLSLKLSNTNTKNKQVKKTVWVLDSMFGYLLNLIGPRIPATMRPWGSQFSKVKSFRSWTMILLDKVFSWSKLVSLSFQNSVMKLHMQNSTLNV